jgi:transcriptional regulator with XRE-family HTH domain
VRTSTRERARDRGHRRGERLLTSLLAEAREARLSGNLSQTEVGGAIGVSRSQYGLIERGGHPNVPFIVVAEILSVLGLELAARAYPAGGGLRDAAQLALLARFRERVATSFTWRTEVVIPIEGDLRAWDAALTRPGLRIGIDAETRLRDVQAVDRRVALKLRDSAFDRAVLLVAATKTNRRLLHDAGDALVANYPVRTREGLAALAAGADPGGNCLVML